MFLDDGDEHWKRLRNRTVVLAGLLALVGLDGAAGEVDVGGAVNNAGSIPPAPVAVDGGAPLFLDLPPVVPVEVTPVARAEAAPAFGVPATVLSAYRLAADRVTAADPGCRLTWPVLAGIGRVESNHARNGNVTPQGDMRSPIYGPVLDGAGPNAAIRDGGGWARAAGPMQFIPSTWAKWAADGSGDGRADPQNVFDATLAAGGYLCAGNTDLSTTDGLRGAILRYNHSEEYVQAVTGWIRAYEQGGGAAPDLPEDSVQADVPPDDLAAGRPPAPPPAQDDTPAPPDQSEGAEPPAEPSPPPQETAPPAECPAAPKDPVVEPVLCAAEPVRDAAVEVTQGIGSRIADPAVVIADIVPNSFKAER